ncbi:radical SAM protein [Candidatus Woesearchaeota archaeon]|nr:radical SAM protein [Candidatus Woesearchaeota archaeon]
MNEVNTKILKINKTPWHSWCTGKISKGCAYCVQGRKLVLFITGLCPQRCFYCPVGEQKFGNDVVYANEWKLEDPNNPVELIKEAELTQAKGAGITGGDPLMNIKRCCNYIQLLKKKFGKEFHIHLYTPLKLVTKERLQKLSAAGLDEIRFHPDLDDNSLWNRIKIAKKYRWEIGIEIPAIPGYEKKTMRLIDYIIFADSLLPELPNEENFAFLQNSPNKVSFINLNELELSDTETKHYTLPTKGFKAKDNISYGVKGSKEMAIKMLEYAKEKGLSAHFCTARLKDGIQVKKRLQIRAENIKLLFDEKTEDGTLLRCCIYLPELAPGMNYREKLRNADKNDFIEKLTVIRNKLLETLTLSEKEIVIDSNKCRLIIPRSVAKQYANKIKKYNLLPALVEEYPTQDGFEVEIEFL